MPVPRQPGAPPSTRTGLSRGLSPARTRRDLWESPNRPRAVGAVASAGGAQATMRVVLEERSPQATVIGQVPAGACRLTRQVQLRLPSLSAVAVPRSGAPG